MSQFSTINHDKIKQKNLSIKINTDDLSPNQIIGAIDNIIDDSRDVILKDFMLLEYPDSTNVNDLLNGSLTDLKHVKESIVSIPNIVTAEYNATIAGVNLVNAKSAELQNRLNVLKLTIEKRGNTNNYYAILNFTSPDQIDFDFPINTSYAFVDNTTGTVSLNRTVSESVDNAVLKVLKSNKNDIRNIEDDTPVNFFYEGLFYGDPQDAVPEGDNFHFAVRTNPTRVASEQATIAEITAARAKVFDNNIDTAWICQYVQSIDDQSTVPLDLTILIDLKKTHTISNLSLIPHQVNRGDFIEILDVRAGTDTASMSSLNVFKNNIEDTNSKTTEAIATSAPENGDINNRINLMFNPVFARYISMDLRQSNIVQTPYKLLKVKAIRKDPTSSSTVSAIFTLGYLETLSLATKYAKNIDPNILIPAVLNLNGDWSMSPDLDQKTATDRVSQTIGISEIKVSNNTYAAISEIVSAKQVFPNDIASVTISADEIIPNEFGTGDWIEYNVSFDGNTFYRIMPIGTGNTKDQLPSIVRPSGSYQSLILKATLKRPNNATNLTPVIKNIKINVETK